MANVVTRLRDRVFTVHASAARTATPDTKEFEIAPAVTCSALYLVIDVTAVTATPSVTFTVSGVDRVSGKIFTVLASAAITATGTTVLHIGPGVTAAANVSEDQYLPPIFRVTATHADADSITYSVAGMLCP